MEAVKIFSSVTGLRPYSFHRSSFTLAAMVATLVITKLVNAYLFCGFNKNIHYYDLPLGVALLVSYCVASPLWAIFGGRLQLGRRAPLLGVHDCGFIGFAVWSFLSGLAIFSIMFLVIPLVSTMRPSLYLYPILWEKRLNAGDDVFNICNGTTLSNVRERFSNATPTFDVLQRIDWVYKIAVYIGWLIPMSFAFATYGCAIAWLTEMMPPEPAASETSDESASDVTIREAEELECIIMESIISDGMPTMEEDDNDSGNDSDQEFSRVDDSMEKISDVNEDQK